MKRLNASSGKGFTLLELVIVLGVTGLIFGGLWALLSSSNNQLIAQSTAQQYRQVIGAVRQFATDGRYATTAAGSRRNVSIANLQAATLLPATFPTRDSFGNTFQIIVETIDGPRNQFRYMVYSNGAVAVDDKVGAQIAALIGADGGFIYAQDTDGCLVGTAANRKACGAYGSFGFDVTTWGIAAGSGRVATMSYTGDTNTGIDPYLYRAVGYAADKYVAQSTISFSNAAGLSPSLLMQGNTISMGTAVGSANNGGNLNMARGNILMNRGTISMADAVGATVNGGDLNMAAGTIRMNTGPIIMGGGVITMGAGTGSTGGGGNLNMASGSITNANQLLGRDITVQTSVGNIRLIGQSSVTVQSSAGTALDVVGTARANTMEAGTFIYSSDLNNKENLQPIKSALEKILQLRGLTYDWKASHERDVGLIAQDVERVFPELVGITSNGRKGVDYAKIVAPLVEAIRELKRDNDDLRKELKSLKDDRSKAP